MITSLPQTISLEEYLQRPLDHTEWIDGQVLEKNGMTSKHGRTQIRLGTRWSNYKDREGIGGEIYTETACRTKERVRRPDVSYLTPELLEVYPDFNVLPQSFPLVAEVISPTDEMEAVFSKVNEYLASGSQEVWLILPESFWIIVITQSQRFLWTRNDTAQTQVILPGFTIAVNELLG